MNDYLKKTGYTPVTKEDLDACYSEIARLEKELKEEKTGSEETWKWIHKKLERGYSLLDRFRETKSKKAANAYLSCINDEIIDPFSLYYSQMKEPQKKVVKKFSDFTDEAVRNKEIYFSGGWREVKGHELDSDGEPIPQFQDEDRRYKDMERAYNEGLISPDELMGEMEVMKARKTSNYDENGKQIPLSMSELAF